MSRLPESHQTACSDRYRHRRGHGGWLDHSGPSQLRREVTGRHLDRIRTLIERARQKRLQPQEYTGATFSISNLGMFDVENFIAVLMPPQAASIAVGTIRDVPVVEEGR